MNKFINGLLISLWTFRKSTIVAIRSFFIIENVRFTILFLICLLYAQAVARHIIPERKYIVIFFGILYLMSFFVMV